jgi:hypothetical protein
MTYEEQAKKAKAEEVSYALKSNFGEGEVFIGKLEQIEKVHFQATNSDLNGYLFDTDAGRVQVVLGAGTDKLFPLEPGDVYRITYQGKKAISGGKNMNLFKIEKLTFDESSKEAKKA